MDGHPDFQHDQWKYYLEEAEQEPEVVEQLNKIKEEHARLKPEDIKVMESKTPNLIQINDCPLRGVA